MPSSFLVLFSFFILRQSLSCAPTGDSGFTTTIPTTTTTEPKQCSLCEEQFIFTTPDRPEAGEKYFTEDYLYLDDVGCLHLELLCEGNQATIEYNMGANGVDQGTESVTALLVCNEAGDAWVRVGDNIPILDASCAAADRDVETPECKTCNLLLVDTTPVAGLNEKEFDSDIVDASQPCAVRTLTCNGVDATIEFNRGMGIVSRPAGSVSVSARLYCNAAGTGWYFDRRDPSQLITAATCAVA